MTDDAIKAQLFNIYEDSGADTDGDMTFHCSIEEAFVTTLQAVVDLKANYEESLRELY